MLSSPAFERACEWLERHTEFDRLTSRGTVRILLKAAGLEPQSVRPSELRVAVERLLPVELERRGIADAGALCERLAGDLARARSIRFLCTGNVVRSAFAELLARHLGCALEVDSAATVYQNEGLFPETRAALRARGVPESLCAGFTPRRLDRLPADADPDRLVLGMSREHLEAYARARGHVEPRHRVLELLGRPEDLRDPVLEGADFEQTFATLERALRRLVRVLEDS